MSAMSSAFLLWSLTIAIIHVPVSLCTGDMQVGAWPFLESKNKTVSVVPVGLHDDTSTEPELSLDVISAQPTLESRFSEAEPRNDVTSGSLVLGEGRDLFMTSTPPLLSPVSPSIDSLQQYEIPSSDDEKDQSVAKKDDKFGEEEQTNKEQTDTEHTLKEQTGSEQVDSAHTDNAQNIDKNIESNATNLQSSKSLRDNQDRKNVKNVENKEGAINRINKFEFPTSDSTQAPRRKDNQNVHKRGGSLSRQNSSPRRQWNSLHGYQNPNVGRFITAPKATPWGFRSLLDYFRSPQLQWGSGLPYYNYGHNDPMSYTNRRTPRTNQQLRQLPRQQNTISGRSLTPAIQHSRERTSANRNVDSLRRRLLSPYHHRRLQPRGSAARNRQRSRAVSPYIRRQHGTFTLTASGQPKGLARSKQVPTSWLDILLSQIVNKQQRAPRVLPHSFSRQNTRGMSTQRGRNTHRLPGRAHSSRGVITPNVGTRKLLSNGLEQPDEMEQSKDNNARQLGTYYETGSVRKNENAISPSTTINSQSENANGAEKHLTMLERARSSVRATQEELNELLTHFSLSSFNVPQHRRNGQFGAFNTDAIAKSRESNKETTTFTSPIDAMSSKTQNHVSGVTPWHPPQGHKNTNRLREEGEMSPTPFMSQVTTSNVDEGKTLTPPHGGEFDKDDVTSRKTYELVTLSHTSDAGFREETQLANEKEREVTGNSILVETSTRQEMDPVTSEEYLVSSRDAVRVAEDNVNDFPDTLPDQVTTNDPRDISMTPYISVSDSNSTTEDGNSRITTEEGNSGITPEEGNSRITTEEVNSGITTVEGDSIFTSEEGNSRLTTEEGNLRITTKEGNPRITTEEGNSRITTEEGNSRITTEEGNSRITTEEGNSGITTEEGNLGITSEEGNSGITPEEGNSGITTEKVNSIVTTYFPDKTHDLTNDFANTSDSSSTALIDSNSEFKSDLQPETKSSQHENSLMTTFSQFSIKEEISQTPSADDGYEPIVRHPGHVVAPRARITKRSVSVNPNTKNQDSSDNTSVPAVPVNIEGKEVNNTVYGAPVGTLPNVLVSTVKPADSSVSNQTEGVTLNSTSTNATAVTNISEIKIDNQNGTNSNEKTSANVSAESHDNVSVTGAPLSQIDNSSNTDTVVSAIEMESYNGTSQQVVNKEQMKIDLSSKLVFDNKTEQPQLNGERNTQSQGEGSLLHQEDATQTPKGWAVEMSQRNVTTTAKSGNTTLTNSLAEEEEKDMSLQLRETPETPSVVMPELRNTENRSTLLSRTGEKSDSHPEHGVVNHGNSVKLVNEFADTNSKETVHDKKVRLGRSAPATFRTLQNPEANPAAMSSTDKKRRAEAGNAVADDGIVTSGIKLLNSSVYMITKANKTATWTSIGATGERRSLRRINMSPTDVKYYKTQTPQNKPITETKELKMESKQSHGLTHRTDSALRLARGELDTLVTEDHPEQQQSATNLTVKPQRNFHGQVEWTTLEDQARKDSPPLVDAVVTVDKRDNPPSKLSETSNSTKPKAKTGNVHLEKLLWSVLQMKNSEQSPNKSAHEIPPYSVKSAEGINTINPNPNKSIPQISSYSVKISRSEDGHNTSFIASSANTGNFKFFEENMELKTPVVHEKLRDGMEGEMSTSEIFDKFPKAQVQTNPRVDDVAHETRKSTVHLYDMGDDDRARFNKFELDSLSTSQSENQSQENARSTSRKQPSTFQSLTSSLVNEKRQKETSRPHTKSQRISEEDQTQQTWITVNEDERKNDNSQHRDAQSPPSESVNQGQINAGSVNPADRHHTGSGYATTHRFSDASHANVYPDPYQQVGDDPRQVSQGMVDPRGPQFSMPFPAPVYLTHQGYYDPRTRQYLPREADLQNPHMSPPVPENEQIPRQRSPSAVRQTVREGSPALSDTRAEHPTKSVDSSDVNGAAKPVEFPQEQSQIFSPDQKKSVAQTSFTSFSQEGQRSQHNLDFRSENTEKLSKSTQAQSSESLPTSTEAKGVPSWLSGQNSPPLNPTDGEISPNRPTQQEARQNLIPPRGQRYDNDDPNPNMQSVPSGSQGGDPRSMRQTRRLARRQNDVTINEPRNKSPSLQEVRLYDYETDALSYRDSSAFGSPRRRSNSRTSWYEDPYKRYPDDYRRRPSDSGRRSKDYGRRSYEYGGRSRDPRVDIPTVGGQKFSGKLKLDSDLYDMDEREVEDYLYTTGKSHEESGTQDFLSELLKVQVVVSSLGRGAIGTGGNLNNFISLLTRFQPGPSFVLGGLRIQYSFAFGDAGMALRHFQFLPLKNVEEKEDNKLVGKLLWFKVSFCECALEDYPMIEFKFKPFPFVGIIRRFVYIPSGSLLKGKFLS